MKGKWHYNGYKTTACRFAVFLIFIIALPQSVYFFGGLIERVSYMDDTFDYAPQLCVFLMIPLVYTLVRQTVTFNELLRKAYFDSKPKENTFGALAFLLRSNELWLKAAVLFAVYTVLPLRFTQKACEILYGDSAWTRLALLSAILAVALVACLSAVRFWNKRVGVEKPRQSYIACLCIACAGYSIGIEGLKLLIPTVLSFVPLIKEFVLSKYMIALVCFFVLLALCKYLRALLKRRACVKRLKKLCAENGFELSALYRPYLSVLRRTDCANFTVSAHGKSYDCKFISARKKKLPLIIRADGALSFVHTVKLVRTELFEYTRDSFYKFESDNIKVLILNPAPKKVTTILNGRLVLLDNGDEVAGYSIYTATAFMNALERNVLHKK